MTDIIVMAIVLVIVGSAAAYIYKEKKKGARCVGCSFAGHCGKACSGGCCTEGQPEE